MNKPSNVPPPKKSVSTGNRFGATEDVEARRGSSDIAEKLRERIAGLLATSPELVVVHRIWSWRFRINVLRPNPGSGSLKGTLAIARSYFIRTDEQGEIVRCEPLLTKHESPSTS